MNARPRYPRILRSVGGIALLLGAIDPLEGSVLIFAGAGLITLGAFAGPPGRRPRLYWTLTFVLIATGVAAMFVLSAFGGIGGSTGHSWWWGLLILPYPLGWFMGVAGMLAAWIRLARQRPSPPA